MKRIIGMLPGAYRLLLRSHGNHAALISGYMWHSDQLTEENVPTRRLQDVDLKQLAEAQHRTGDEVPAEEPSLSDMLRHQQIQDRNFEVKNYAAAAGRSTIIACSS